MSWAAIRSYHVQVRRWNDIGYHFGIEDIQSSYEILTGRMMNEQGAHAKGQNVDNIGICFVGNFNKHEVPPTQWQLGVRFVSSLCRVLNIDIDNVFGHKELCHGYTCPGIHFDMEGFRTQLQDIM